MSVILDALFIGDEILPNILERDYQQKRNIMSYRLIIIITISLLAGCNFTTPTAMPTNTPAPTSTLITSTASPIAYPTEVITPENAAAVSLLGFLPPPQQGEDELVGVSDFALLPVSDALDASDKIFVAHGFFAQGNPPYPSLIKGIPVWDIATGKLEQLFGATNTKPTYKLALSADGESLITIGVVQYSVSRWHVSTGQLADKRVMLTSSPAYNIAISPDGQLVAGVSGTEGGFSIHNINQLWPPVGGESHDRDAYGNADGGTEVVFSPDGNKLASTGWRRDVYLWNVKTGNRSWKKAGDRKHYGNRGLSFSPNGRLLAAADSEAIRIYDVKNGDVIHQMGHADKYLTSLAFSPDGRLLVAGTRNVNRLGGPGKATLQIWEVETGQLLHIFNHPVDVTKVAFSHDGKLVISGGIAGVIRLWGWPST